MKTETTTLIEGDTYEDWDEENGIVRGFQGQREAQFNANYKNYHVFRRKSLPDRKLIRMRFLERGDVIRKCGTIYIVMHLTDGVI